MLSKSKTKLVCTIGPASANIDIIRNMILSGMNMARLNFSHGTHETHKVLIDMIHKASAELGMHVGILQDLCGPKIRLGILPDEGIQLRAGENVILREASRSTEGTIPVDYEGLHKEIKIGESILIADGIMDLEIIEINDYDVVCKVISGGMAFTKKGVNLPKSKLRIPAFSAKDRADLEFGLKERLDYIALSFVRSAEDLEEISDIISNSSYHPKLIAKIEKPQAMENLESIIKAVDGVMVARGDLGVEVPFEEVPHMQKIIINKARSCGAMVITATQMLQSMVLSPRPTRSETTDVANAVAEGTDALMLSDETANGHYPLEAVKTLSKIAKAAERYSLSSLSMDFAPLDYSKRLDNSQGSDVYAEELILGLARAACWLAKDINAKAIVAMTSTGYTAYSIARFRPSSIVLALAPTDEACRKISLIWGTEAILIDEVKSSEEMISVAIEKVREAGYARLGDKIVVVAGLPFGTHAPINFLRVVDII